MIAMTLQEAIAAHTAIEQLPRLRDPKISYHLGRIGDLLEPEVRRHEKERNKIIIGYNYTNKDGVNEVPPAKLNDFNEQVERLLTVEVQVDKNTVTLTQVIGDDPKRYPEVAPWQFKALQKVILEDATAAA